MKKLLSASLLFVCFASLACGTSEAEQACLDTADAVGKAAQRCGLDYEANRTAFIQTGAGGDCANIDEIRDEGSLRGACFSSMGTVSCDDLKAGKLDASCSKQLIRED
jgi:hypothetical protein